MTKTCSERIEEISGIDVYRAIVVAIPATAAMSGTQRLWGNAMEHFFPDPSVYAAKIEGDPATISRRARKLGPGAGNDTSMAGLYEEGIQRDLTRALVELDKYWEGRAADQFATVYMPELRRHLKDLADACEKQKEAANKIQERIIRAHDEVVGIVQQMVRTVISRATVGAASEGLSLAASGYTTSAAAAVGSATAVGVVAVAGFVIAAIIEELIDYHSQIGDAITSLNTDLGMEFTNVLQGIEQERFVSKADRYVSEAGWHPQVGV